MNSNRLDLSERNHWQLKLQAYIINVLICYNRNKGAAIVNCDLIAHDLYKPGLPLNGTLAENFGHDILTQSGEIDRTKLGQIVFSDKVCLTTSYGLDPGLLVRPKYSGNNSTVKLNKTN